MKEPKHPIRSSIISCVSFADRKLQGGHLWVHEVIHKAAVELDRDWTGPCEPIPLSQVCVLTSSDSLSARVDWVPEISHHRGGLLLLTPRIWGRPEARLSLWKLTHLGYRITVRPVDPALYGDPSHQSWRAVYYAKPAWSVTFPDPTHMPWPSDAALQLAGLGLYKADQAAVYDTRGKALHQTTLAVQSSTQEWDRFPLTLKALVVRLFVNLALFEDTVPCSGSTPCVSTAPVDQPPSASGSPRHSAPTSFVTG